MDYTREFATVDLLLKSDFETRAVDSFAISLMKVERQTRRIFTYLIYQHPNYKQGDGTNLRKVLADNSAMYLDTFIRGIDHIYSKTVEQVYGKEYKTDFDQISIITKDRNKIFHGQVTNKRLSREDLVSKVALMRKWCKTMADSFSQEIKFNGFERNAYQKAPIQLTLRNENQFGTLVAYKNLLASLRKK